MDLLKNISFKKAATIGPMDSSPTASASTPSLDIAAPTSSATALPLDAAAITPTTPPLDTTTPATTPPLDTTTPATTPPLDTTTPASTPPLDTTTPASTPLLDTTTPATTPPLDTTTPVITPPLDTTTPVITPPLDAAAATSVIAPPLDANSNKHKKIQFCICFPTNNMQQLTINYKPDPNPNSKITNISSITIPKLNFQNNENFKKFNELFYYLNIIDDNIPNFNLKFNLFNKKNNIKEINNVTDDKLKQLGINKDINNLIKLINELINKLVSQPSLSIDQERLATEQISLPTEQPPIVPDQPPITVGGRLKSKQLYVNKFKNTKKQKKYQKRNTKRKK